MKTMKILALAFGIVFLSRDPTLAGQQEVTFRYEDTLSSRTCLFEADVKTGLAPEKERQPDILLLVRIFGGGLSAKPAGQLDSLRTYFRLPELTLREESLPIKIAWRVYEEGKNGRQETKTNQKISQVAELNGDRYTVFIIPQQISVKDKLNRFLFEIRRNKRKEDGGFYSSELLLAKELLWNFYGPLAIGFFFPDKVYFLTFTIWASWSNSGLRTGGAAMSWII